LNGPQEWFDGISNFLLVCFTADGVYGADSWHQSLADASALAETPFGVQLSEWGP
jgi:hypothetical protein